MEVEADAWSSTNIVGYEAVDDRTIVEEESSEIRPNAESPTQADHFPSKI